MQQQMRSRGGFSSPENLRSSAENILRLGRIPTPEIPTARDGDEQQYRIKSANEPHERVAKQSQLEPAL